MKIAIVGAGAIGGYAGVKLALAGERVTFLARGANLEAIRSRGVKLLLSDGTELVADDVQATADYSIAGPQDIVILAVKAHQMEAVANDVPKLFGPETSVVTMQNGIRTLVLSPAWRSVRGPVRGGGRSDRAVPAPDPTGARHWLRGLSRVRARGARSHSPHRRRSLSGERAGRVGEQPGACRFRMLHARRISGAGAGQHPRRDLAQTLGQSHLQSHQRADARHARRHLPVSRYPETGGGDDDGSASSGRQPWYLVPSARSSGASPAPSEWGSTRPPCSTTSRPVG